MSTITHAIIAAAGRGKRLGMGKPKCLIEVQGSPIIAYQLHLLRHVPDVRVVVGFSEYALMEQVKKIRQDVIFVRNPNFRHTGTLQSLHMAAKGLDDYCLCLDGDMIIEEKSFERFVEICDLGQPYIGVSDEITTDPVYAHVKPDPGGLIVHGFSRSNAGDGPAYEWANVAYIPSTWLNFEHTDVFKRLERQLPIKAACLRRLEIDTPEDLSLAEDVMAKEPQYCNKIPLLA